MKAIKLLAAAALTLLFTLPVNSAGLNLNNGIAAGKALVGLYTQFKADGKLDLSNANNLSNIMTLANNIKGLSELANKSTFLKGLISGSNNLVNNSNSTSVLSNLGKLSNLDLASLANGSLSSAAASAATGALTGALSNVATGGSTQTSSSSSSVASTATSLLTSIFKTFK